MTQQETDLLNKNPIEIPHSLQQGAVYASLILMRPVTVEEFKEFLNGIIQEPDKSET